jgi:hypothetical protein
MTRFQYFYENSALTFEGVSQTVENADFIKTWLHELGANQVDEVQLNWIKGAEMNEHYALTGDNAYPEDLTILVIEPGHIDLVKVTIPRFEYGGRWFDDVVDNNLRREAEAK